MAVAFVQAKAQETANSTTDGAVLPSAVTSGNLLVVGVYAFGETTSSITVSDNTGWGNTYTKVLSAWQADSLGSDWFNLYYTVLQGSGTHACTVTATGPASGFWGIAVAEFSGMGTPTTPTVKGGAALADSTSSYSGPTFTPAAGDLLIGFYGDEGGAGRGFTAGSGWSMAASSSIGDNNCSLIYVLSAAGTATHAQWTFGNSSTDPAGSVYMALTPGGGAPADPFPLAYPFMFGEQYSAVYRM